MTLAPPTLADLTEKEWAAQVYELLATLGWSRYHTWRSKHSPAGYPDETCWRERVLWLELKREGGKLSAEQKRVIGGLLAAGAEVYVVRPRDLDALAKVLAVRAPAHDLMAWPPEAWQVHVNLLGATRKECA